MNINSVYQRFLARRSILSATNRRSFFSGCEYKVLDGYVNKNSQLYQDNYAMMQECTSLLQSRVEDALQGGGRRHVERHRSRKKLMPRDRVQSILDPGSPFLELSQLAGYELYGEDRVPSGGMVTGIGLVHGRHCLIVANDATTTGGTYYPIGVRKHLRAQEIAAENNLPCIYLVDSGGANLPR